MKFEEILRKGDVSVTEKSISASMQELLLVPHGW